MIPCTYVMYICRHTYMHAYIYKDKCKCLYQSYMGLHVCLCVFMYVCMYIARQARVYAFVFACI